MSGLSMKMPDVFIDAKSMISDILDQNSKISEMSYQGLFSNLCDVTHYHIAEVEDEEGYSNLDIILTYKKHVMSSSNQFETVETTRNLRVLSPLGDNLWTFRMKNKVWEGNYPSTVAVDVETKEVFFFSLKVNRIEIILFGKMTDEQFEAFRYDVNDREPFSIKLDDKAMFDFIDGAEGITHLQKNVVVEFNCGMPIKVKNNRELITK